MAAMASSAAASTPAFSAAVAAGAASGVLACVLADTEDVDTRNGVVKAAAPAVIAASKASKSSTGASRPVGSSRRYMAGVAPGKQINKER